MSSSQLTLTPSFFRGVGRKTTNQMITLYIHQPIGGSSCYKWSISIISQLVSDCLGVIIVTPPERNMSGLYHPKLLYSTPEKLAVLPFAFHIRLSQSHLGLKMGHTVIPQNKHCNEKWWYIMNHESTIEFEGSLFRTDMNKPFPLPSQWTPGRCCKVQLLLSPPFLSRPV